ncbi:hypothetical protein QE152_g15476 [Popillia japonica]|uniref:Uncharacterized protein n=1 Tax=Popillia japonica TaxID=7064 RepID=A0AAW1L8E4_POPJA
MHNMEVPIKRIMIPKPSNDGKTKEIPSAAVQVSTNCPEHPPLRKNGERHLLISGNTDNFYENFRSTKIWIYILRFLYRWRQTHPAPNRNNRLSLEIRVVYSIAGDFSGKEKPAEYILEPFNC